MPVWSKAGRQQAKGSAVPKDGYPIDIRPGLDSDSPGLIELVGGCFAEYEGCKLDLAGIDAALTAPATAFEAEHGRFWVAEVQGRIIGSIGYAIKDDGRTVELKKLYVDSDCRRRGLATKLYGLVYQAAADLGAEAIDLWSDTRFREAHAFYLTKGFGKLGETRYLNDPSETTEYHFILPLSD